MSFYGGLCADKKEAPTGDLYKKGG
jgi:hypothetical protein